MKKIFPERFKGQVIVLTGAARGIGKATALRAAREGARLVLTDRLEKEGSEVLKAVTEEGHQQCRCDGKSRPCARPDKGADGLYHGQ